MALVIRPDYHAIPTIEKNGLDWISSEKFEREGGNAVRIGILNIMPLGEQYEMNILNPLGLSLVDIEPVWIKLESHSYKTWPEGHIEGLYTTYSEVVKANKLDGLIVTGAPVEHLNFEEVNYWDEISELIRDARQNSHSTLGLCWAGFALAKLSGVEKITFEKKLFGVYELDNLATSHPIMGALDDKFVCPQSRFAGFDDKEVLDAVSRGDVNALAYGRESGYTILESPDHKQLMHIGHPEYNKGRLAEEARRDQGNPNVPDIENFDFDNPLNRWRMHRNTFFQRWINFVTHESRVI
ncbi:homoserine O-succinyltransferase [Chloroflexi bacterium]|nr:homoserine O-succinyltransferase [Chloroflexota bacterium]